MSARRPARLVTPAAAAVLLLAAAAPAATPTNAPTATVKIPAPMKVDGYRALRDGGAAFQEKKFDAARDAFAKAEQDPRLDPAIPKFDQAAALLRMNQSSNAVPLLRDALSTTNLPVQAQSYFNLGAARAAEAEELAKAQKLKEAVQSIGDAIGMYKSSIALDPADVAAKKNYELARRRAEELKKLQEEQQKQQQQQQDQQKQDQQKQDQQQDQSKQDQQKQDQQKQDQSKSDQQQQQDQQQKQDQQQQPSSNDQQKQDVQNQQDQPQPGDQTKAGEMTREEAMSLLDAMKEEEAAARERMRLNLGRPVPVDKDW